MNNGKAFGEATWKGCQNLLLQRTIASLRFRDHGILSTNPQCSMQAYDLSTSVDLKGCRASCSVSHCQLSRADITEVMSPGSCVGGQSMDSRTWRGWLHSWRLDLSPSLALCRGYWGSLAIDVDPQEALDLLKGKPADASCRRQLE